MVVGGVVGGVVVEVRFPRAVNVLEDSTGRFNGDDSTIKSGRGG